MKVIQRIKKTNLLMISFFILFSCEFKEVNDDAQSYCDCKTRQYEGKTDAGECPKLLARLKEKYEYFPDEYEMLANRIGECLAE
ncbi:MAG: hypothetical protein ACSHXL_06360 [Bacteroidota bacterium]